MNVLVVYSFDYTQGIRNALLESIFCFRDYEDVHFYHYNYDIKMSRMLYLLRRVKFDAVLFHYAFICEMRWGEKSKHEKILQDFKNCWPEAVKGIIPQDEYYMPSRTGRFIQEAGINIVYTLASGKNIGILYSEYLKNVKVYTVLTGYLDMNTLKKVERLKKEFKGRERQYRIGYRGRSVNYALGKIGNIKTSMVDEFNKRLKDYPIATNIMNTGEDKNVFWGDDWYRFLLNCDTVLGCMGGSIYC